MIKRGQWDVLEAVPDAMLLVDHDGAIVFANTQAAELFGYTRQELTELRLESLLPDRFRAQHSKHRATYTAEPTVRSMGGRDNLTAIRKDGRELPVGIKLCPLESDDGLLVAASIRDISKHMTVERQLRSALRDVEELKERLRTENVYLREEIKDFFDDEEIIGQSDVLRIMLHKVDQVAGTNASVLITGESGTGKELIARAIHNRSERKDRPLIKVNCAALPTGLIESELFGHEKGAFTGAFVRKMGRFEVANGSTIFLDEIGEFQPEVQTKLLRVLQEGDFERIGSNATTHVDVRVIAATNRDLHSAIKQQRFRLDLYYRLAVFPIEVPPLRIRRDDIPLLVTHFVTKFQANLGKKIEEISVKTMDQLQAYDWPGNIRELENVVQRAMILSSGSTLQVEELSTHPNVPGARETKSETESASKSVTIEEVDRAHILRVLQECRWQIKGRGAAAERLGLKPSTLRYRMNKLGIQRPH